MAVAAFHGDLATMQYLHGSHLGHVTVRALEYAALNGHMHVLHWLSRFHDSGVESDALAMACVHGRVDVVRFLREAARAPVTMTALATAAHTGHRRLVRFLLDAGHVKEDEDDADALQRTYDTNHTIDDHVLGCVRSTFIRSSPVDAAASQGHLAVLQLLVEHGGDVTTKTMDAAVMHGHLDVVCYLRAAHGQSGTVHHLCTALQVCRVDLASYLLAQLVMGADGDDVQRLLVCAAGSGNIAFLAQLSTVVAVDARPRTQELMLVHAVLHRHVHMLTHLCEIHGFKWTPNVHHVATLLGRKKELKYLRTLGPAAESVVYLPMTVGVIGYNAILV